MFALQQELKVFTGSANRDLAERICKYIGTPLGQATISSFPDGETYVRIEENIRGHDVFIVQPTSPTTTRPSTPTTWKASCGRRSRLNDEHVVPSNVLLDPD